MDKKTRGRPKKVLEDIEKQKKQEKSHEYYVQFREKHKDDLPEYYRKPNAIIGRPPKTKLEKVIEEKGDDKNMTDILDNLKNLILELKEKLK